MGAPEQQQQKILAHPSPAGGLTPTGLPGGLDITGQTHAPKRSSFCSS